MAPSIRSFHAIALSWLIISATASAAPHQDNHNHDKLTHAVHEKRFQKGPPVMGLPPRNPIITMSSPRIFTYITPSPGATPVAVTKESQIITSYVPQFTLCELPPVAFFSVSPVSGTSPATAAYQNLSASIPTGTGTCTTIYDPTITMVCATTLTALDKQYTLTNCNEGLTFSTEYGYILTTPSPTVAANASVDDTATITAAPTIETLTTYYLAPWQQLTAGTAPSEVDLKVCRSFTNGSMECIREYQIWETSMVTLTATTVTSINISTTIHGASQLIVETFVANVTETLTTFSMSTTMDLEFQTEYTTTNSANRTSAVATPTGSDVYQTITVEYAPTSAVPGNSGIVPPTEASETSGGNKTTTTLHLTSTIIAGTRTVTVQPNSISEIPVASPAEST